jgi:hypothetical protein
MANFARAALNPFPASLAETGENGFVADLTS